MSATVPEHRPETPTRRQIMAERRRRSPVWRIIHWAGSLQLALILLATIAIACAVATFAESGFNTQIAQAYIYKAPWFLVWLGVLCINLFAVTLTRWPWQKKHIGFVVTHYGIITLLVGAMIGLHTGFEGNVALRLDGPPVHRVTTNRSIIQLESPTDSALYTMPFRAETARLGNGRSRSFPVPGTDLQVIADDYSPNMLRQERLVPGAASDAGPGISLQFHSTMMGQQLEIPMLLDNHPAEKDFFGLARIIFSPSLREQIESPRETQVVFARFAPIISGAINSGIKVLLSSDGKTVSILGADGRGASFARSELLRSPVIEGGATIVVEEYWPDFAMENGKPVTKSSQPNNPAILVHISPPVSTSERKPTLELAPLPNDRAAYRISRNGQPYASGEVGTGDTISLRWADWQARVTAILSRAAINSEVLPGPALPKGMQGIPGFRARLVSPTMEGQPRWIASGEVVALSDGKDVVRFGYGLETQPLSFSLRLLKFEVPRDEGSDTPADFRATVEFRDTRTGETKTGVARMNHPASFPGTLWANLTGINYKFSQAEWNPRDLEETTLQVLYDPGWLLKWIGSLGICIGIAIMFYWKPNQA